MVTVPLMANTVQEQDPLAGGLRLMRLTGALPFGAVLGGLLAHRLGSRNVTVPGLALAALGLYFMGQWDLDIADPAMSMHLALTGFGFGLVIAPLFLSAMEEGGDEYHATSASLVVVARMLGMAVGVAVLSSWGVGHFQGLTEGVLLPCRPPARPRPSTGRGWTSTEATSARRGWTSSRTSSAAPPCCSSSPSSRPLALDDERTRRLRHRLRHSGEEPAPYQDTGPESA